MPEIYKYKNKAFTDALRKLNNIFESAYLFLLIDQHDDGLWGKSLSSELIKRYSRIEEAQIAEIRKQAKSITVTFHAVDAILSFTRGSISRAVKQALRCLPAHRDANGGYGTFGELISAYPEPRHQIIINCRHTATGLLLHFLFQKKIDEKNAKSIKFLIDHAKKDGGWGVIPDPQKEDAECITTSYVLRSLVLAKKKKIYELLPRRYLLKLDEVIESGLDWLERNNKQNNGLWAFPLKGEVKKKVLYSAGVLSIFPELRNYRKVLYEKTLSRVVSLQRRDGGWPISLKGESKLKSTIWVLSSLVNLKDNTYKDEIVEGIDFIVHNTSEKRYVKDLIVVDWSQLLKLADHVGIHISQERDYELQRLSVTIKNKIFNQWDAEFLRKELPKHFDILRGPISEILEIYYPDIVQYAKFIKLLREEAVVVLGKHGKGAERKIYLKELKNAKDYLHKRGYKAYLINDLPKLSEIYAENERLYMLASKFAIKIYRAAAWSIAEFIYAQEQHTVLAFLTPESLGIGSEMKRQLKLMRIGHIRVFEFNKSFIEVIDKAIKWAEKLAQERKVTETN